MELDKFVRKFVSLWQAGWDANLNVETTAGNAFVSLKVGLGQAKHHVNIDGCRGGSPSRQRRRERRAAARHFDASTEEVVATAKDEVVTVETDTEEVNVKDEAEDCNDSLALVAYELKVDAHVNCKNYDIVEGIEVNFNGALDYLKVDENDDEARYIHVQKVQEKKSLENIKEERKLVAYKVFIRDNITSKAVIESWWESHKFDDLAFRGAVRDKITIRIREIQKL